jgi:hypothetical protein
MATTTSSATIVNGFFEIWRFGFAGESVDVD